MRAQNGAAAVQVVAAKKIANSLNRWSRGAEKMSQMRFASPARRLPSFLGNRRRPVAHFHTVPAHVRCGFPAP